MSKTNAQKAWDEIEAEAQRHPHRPGALNGKRKVRSTLPDLGVYYGVKCREWYTQRGEPVPNGTPTVAAMETEHLKRKGLHR